MGDYIRRTELHGGNDEWGKGVGVVGDDQAEKTHLRAATRPASPEQRALVRTRHPALRVRWLDYRLSAGERTRAATEVEEK